MLSMLPSSAVERSRNSPGEEPTALLGRTARLMRRLPAPRAASCCLVSRCLTLRCYWRWRGWVTAQGEAPRLCERFEQSGSDPEKSGRNGCGGGAVRGSARRLQASLRRYSSFLCNGDAQHLPAVNSSQAAPPLAYRVFYHAAHHRIWPVACTAPTYMTCCAPPGTRGCPGTSRWASSSRP